MPQITREKMELENEAVAGALQFSALWFHLKFNQCFPNCFSFFTNNKKCWKLDFFTSLRVYATKSPNFTVSSANERLQGLS